MIQLITRNKLGVSKTTSQSPVSLLRILQNIKDRKLHYKPKNIWKHSIVREYHDTQSSLSRHHNFMIDLNLSTWWYMLVLDLDEF